MQTVTRFRAARAEHDWADARAFLSEDPRRWWGQHEGDGSPWRLQKGGRWKEWDQHFHGSSVPGSWHISPDGLEVWAVFAEINDYYRLTERGYQHHRQTYFFDDFGLITGLLISSEPEIPGTPAGRADEFATWGAANHQEEWAYLRPGGKIDPTGDRSERTRRLLELWRAEIGLPPINPIE